MKQIGRIIGLTLAASALVSCTGDQDRPVAVVVLGEPNAPFASGARLTAAAQSIRSATAEGLVGFDEQGRVVPALADRWIVTNDGSSFIFRLRDGTWPDGSDLSGESVRNSLIEAMNMARSGPLNGDLAIIDEVRAMAGRVIEIRLKQQMPDLLQVLAQPELGLLHGGRGAGPMRLVRKKSAALLTPIAPEDRGLPQQEDWGERFRTLRLVALPAQRAIDQFNRGEADIVLGGRFADFPRLDASSVPRGAIRLDPVAGLFGLAVVHADGFLSQPENREALAMAIDRDALTSVFNVGGWTSTTRLVNPGLVDDNGSVTERWPGRSIDDRRTAAATRVARWRAAGHSPVVLRIALPVGPGGDSLFARLQADFKAIGLEARRIADNGDADLRLIDSIARYARASWFLNQLSCANAQALCNSQADRIVSRALNEPDTAKRADLYAQAEAQATITNSFIPFGVPIRWSLVAGNATGFVANRWNVHPLLPLALRPK